MPLFCPVARVRGGLRVLPAIEAKDALQATLCTQARYGTNWGIMPHRAALELAFRFGAALNESFQRRCANE